MDTFRGIVTRLVNTRIFKPSVNAPKSQELQPNWDVDISHAIRGEMHRGIDIWYVLTNKTFVWSGAVSTALEVPILSKQFLVTADDIGVVEEINLAAKLALENGWINSIAVLINRTGNEEDSMLEDLHQFLENTNLAGTSKPLSETTHVGLHFTISSGSPVSPVDEVNLLVDDKGYFPEYRGFDGKYKEDECVGQVMLELTAQYDKFKRIFKREPDHFTSHHDVHTFAYPLFENIHKWAIAKSIPIRSHSFLPQLGRSLYGVNIPKLNLPSIDTMDDWSARLGSTSSSDHTLVSHYGPVPFMPLLSYKRVVAEKHTKLDDGIYDFLVSKDRSREIMVHIIKSDVTKKKQFIELYEGFSKEYPGVDTRYFAGRRAEFISLKTRKSSLAGKTNSYLVPFDFIQPEVRRV